MIPIKTCSVPSRPKGGRLFRPNCRDAGSKQARRVCAVVAILYVPAVLLCVITGLLDGFAHAAQSYKYSVERPVINLQGGCIAPSAPNEHIRLDIMRVTFRGKRDSYLVDARYRLFNTGKTVTVTVGVPKYGRPDRDEKGPKPIVRDFIGFDAWVNGRKAEFVESRDFFTDLSARPIGGYCHGDKPAETRWMTKRVTFTEKATTFIRIRYEAHYYQYILSGFVEDRGHYHVSIGRYWKDTIKKAVFVSDVTDINRERFRSIGMVAFTDFIVVYEARQWEPQLWSIIEIPGSWEGAEWRAIETRFRRLGPGMKHPTAPTPCSTD